MSMKLRQAVGSQNRYLAYWCQGCDSVHMIRIGDDGWTWNGDRDAPTFQPSVRVTYNGADAGKDRGDGDKAPPAVCHTFIRKGMVEFLKDCTHVLAGKTLPLPDWPYAENEYDGIEPLS